MNQSSAFISSTFIHFSLILITAPTYSKLGGETGSMYSKNHICKEIMSMKDDIMTEYDKRASTSSLEFWF